MPRLRFSIGVATELAKTVRFIVAVAFLDAAAAAIVLWLSSSLREHWRVLLVVGAVIAGVFSALVVLLLYAYLTAPRRDLQIRVGALEQASEGLQNQLNQLIEGQYGDPFQFLPIYHALRTDAREAIRVIQRAQETGRLWPLTGAPEYRLWHRSREGIATNPFARLDGLHGVLQEAFDHVERLSTSTAIRFFGRQVRESDDLDEALLALESAESGLTGAIDRLEGLTGIQPPLEGMDDA